MPERTYGSGNTAAPGEDALLEKLAGKSVCNDIRTVYVIGAHLFQERDLFFRLFPGIKHLYLFEPIPHLFRLLKAKTGEDRRIRVFPCAIGNTDGPAVFHVTNNQASSSLLELGRHRDIFPHVTETETIKVECRRLGSVIAEYGLELPDMLFIDAQGAEFGILSAVAPDILSNVTIIYTEASTEEIYIGAKPLDDIKDLLSRDFRFISFAPLAPHTPTHGNALFVNRRHPDFTNRFDCPDNYRVSAIVSTYNSESFLRGCLDDLIAQTLYPRGELEIIVIDSGSHEDEGAIVGEYQDRFPHIRYIRTVGRESIYQAWNRGIRKARGLYVTNANTDDRHRCDALEAMARELDENPAVALVYGDVFFTRFPNQTFDRHIRCGYHIRPEYSPEIMLSGCHMGPQPMWRRSLHGELGLFSEEFASAGDYEFWCRIALLHPMKHIPRFLGLYYENPKGICNGNASLAADETARVKILYQGQFPLPSQAHATNYQWLETAAHGRYVNIGIVTYNRLEFTRQAIEALVRFTRFPHVVTVVDNGSTDGTREYLSELKRLGIIRNLALLDENVGVAKASNLAWSLEPEASYYLKLDNDIVIRKADWLEAMVVTVDAIPELGAVAYNFETGSYPLDVINGHGIRKKDHGNLGGACILIPKRTERLLGCWCEDYGLYSEEDADYGFRIRAAGLWNAYMEDEDVGDHLPAGRAAVIDLRTLEATDGMEEIQHAEYRRWKDEQRKKVVGKEGALLRNISAYMNRSKPLRVESAFAKEYIGKNGGLLPSDKGNNDMTLLNKETGQNTRHGTDGEILVTAIVSSYNSEQFMRECLTDLVNQTIADRMEIIVVDAASPQSEGSIVADFQRRYDNITYVRTGTRIGVYAAWNIAVKLARGKYITPFSTNDRLSAEAYGVMADALDKNPDVMLVYGDSHHTRIPHETFENHTRCGEFKWPDYSFESLMQACCVGPNPMWRKDVHDSIGYFDEKYVAIGDQDFWLRMGEKYRLLHIPVFTGLYWVSPDALSAENDISEHEVREIHLKYQRRYLERNFGTSGIVEPARSVDKDVTCSIVIPLYNKVEYTRQCLEALVKNTGQSATYEVILVDNCSTDETSTFLQTLSGNVKILKNKSNLGFAKACNQGATASSGKYIVFLNNDTVPHPGWLDALVSGVEREGAEICGAKLLFPNETVQHAGVAFSENECGYHIFRGFPADAAAVSKKRFMQAVTAACMLMNKEIFQKLGGFDEGFVNGYEDVDLCLRAGQAGMKILYNPESVLTHYESSSEGRMIFEESNLDRWHGKWAGKVKVDKPEFLRTEGFVYVEGTGKFRPMTLEEFENAEGIAISFDEHVRNVELFARVVPTNPVVATLARIRMRQNRLLEALEAFRKVKDNGDDSVLADMGDCLASMGELAEAERCYTEASKLLPGGVKGHIGLGVTRLLKGNPAGAALSFQNALKIESSNSKALCGLAMAKSAEGKHAESLSFLERALDADPENQTALHELVKLSYGSGSFAEAETRLTTFLMYHPGDLDMLFALAGILYKSGKYPEAREALERLLALSTDYPGGPELFSLVQKKIFEAPASEPCGIPASGFNPTAEKFAETGRTQKEEGKYEEALESFKSALQLGCEGILSEMGDCQANLGRFDEAAELYTECLRNCPDDCRALVGLGVLNLLQDKQVKAVTWFNRALKTDPANPNALCGLGMIRNLQGKHCEAIKLLSDALEADPENLTALHELVKCSYGLDRFEEAEKSLSTYLMYHPGDLDMQFSLAGVRYRNGNYRDALENVENLLAFAPDFAGGDELLGKIKSQLASCAVG